MDALTVYSYMRVAMPRGARLDTFTENSGEVVITARQGPAASRVVIGPERLMAEDVGHLQRVARHFARRWATMSA